MADISYHTGRSERPAALLCVIEKTNEVGGVTSIQPRFPPGQRSRRRGRSADFRLVPPVRSLANATGTGRTGHVIPPPIRVLRDGMRRRRGLTRSRLGGLYR